MGEEKELELLPPKKRFVCPDCGKKYSRLWKCKDGIKRCTNCKKSKPTNKFYVPKEKRREGYERIGNFYMTEREKNILHKQFISQGMNPVSAWNRVRNHCYQLKMVMRRKRGLEIINRNREMKKKQETQKQKKKFIGGLK